MILALILFEIQEIIKMLPDYYKERSSAAEKLSPKITTSTTETSTENSDKESKNGAEQTCDVKNGTSTVQKKDSSVPTCVPDAVAHVVSLDISWYVHLPELGMLGLPILRQFSFFFGKYRKK